jgi:hypothetical protein
LAKKGTKRASGNRTKKEKNLASQARRRRQADAELQKKYDQIIRSAVSQLATEMLEAGSLVESSEGIPVQAKDGKLTRFGLRDEATIDEVRRYQCLINTTCLYEIKEHPRHFYWCGGFVAGMLTAWAIITLNIASQHELIESLTRHRALGGMAKRKLTPTVAAIAKQYIARELTPGVSKIAACTRAAARLKREHSIDISGKTLMPLVDAAIRENTEQVPD